MEKIKMVDLHRQYLAIKPEIDEAIQQVLDETAFIQGPQVKAFATEFATYNHVRHVIPCANGTDALQIALMGLGLQPGDEVILPVFTYVATAEVIALLRLKPVFVDVRPDDFNIDISQIEQKLTPRTRCIVPVHLFGQCADMEPLVALAAKHNLSIVEDAAQAVGATYTFSNGEAKIAGTMGTIGCTSFFPSKNLGCFGDGGAMLTNDPVLADVLHQMANHGQKRKYYHDSIGVNSRLDTLQAAVLRVKLRRLDEYTRRRQSVAAHYDEALKGITGLTLPVRKPGRSHVFNQYTVQVNKRDDLKDFLASKEIPTMIYYPLPLHLQQAYRQAGIDEGAFPVSEKLSGTVLSLPIHTEMALDQIEYICQSVKEYFA
jgi:dTDP-4-amino-4,6-dideoxygalactose transaminase